jgi:hypothetical protein
MITTGIILTAAQAIIAAITLIRCPAARPVGAPLSLLAVVCDAARMTVTALARA